MLVILLSSILSTEINIFTPEFSRDYLHKIIYEIKIFNRNKNYLNADQFSVDIDKFIEYSENLLEIDDALPFLRTLLDDIYKVVRTEKTCNHYAIQQSMSNMEYILMRKEILLRKFPIQNV